jgi:hypothetical protein
MPGKWFRQDIKDPIQPPDFPCGLFQLGSFHKLPIAVAQREGSLMRARHIKHVDGSALLQ